MIIEIWSDLICPWCYIGKANLDAALAQFPHADEVDVVFRSFQLDPQAPEEPRRAVDYLADRYGAGPDEALGMMRQVAAVAAGAGLECRLEDSLTGQTLDAHRLLHLARDHGVQRDLVQRFFSAHFAENRSLFDADSLVALTSEVGLPATEVREVLAGQRYRDAVDGDLAQARAYGIAGVPFFVIDSAYGVSGAQPPEVLTQVLERAHADKA